MDFSQLRLGSVPALFSLQLLVHFPDSIGQNLGIIALFIVFKEKLFCQKRYIQSVPLGSVQYIVVKVPAFDYCGDGVQSLAWADIVYTTT